MDNNLTVAVKEAFVRLYEKGLIYRANRLVNWSCKMKTALSDIEVEYLELEGPTKMRIPGHDGEYEFGVIESFSYKIENSD
jgi:valyl-tRNA synthetase